jgi:sensor histidine kinase YesM
MKQDITNDLNISRPKVTGIGLSISAVFALLYTAFYTVVLAYTELVPIFDAMIGMFVSTCLKFILLFGSWWIVIRSFHTYSSWLKVSLHILFSLVYAGGWYWGYMELTKLVFGIEILQGGGFIEDRIWILLSAVFEYAIVFSVIHIIYSMKKLRERDKLAAELKELSTQQQIANLKAQLNPHFLFNTLNSINSMASRDVSQTREMISKLSVMLRYSLESFEKKLVPLREELNFVQKYLELEKHRFGERLVFNINVDEHLKDVEIPPMIIQPLVENAVKHGILPSRNGGSVIVVISQIDDKMSVQITDTGQGMPDDFQKNHSDGIGIRNTDQQLKKRYGEEYGLTFDAVQPAGTKASFYIPLN